MFDRVLVLAPHTDDAELGCGGFISKLIENGSYVKCVAFSAAVDSIPLGFSKDSTFKEFVASMNYLGVQNYECLDFQVREFPRDRQKILDRLISLRKEGFDLVITPSSTDVHQDHQVIHQEALRAFKSVTVLGYELPWNQLVSNNTLVVELTEAQLQAKIKALLFYLTQSGRQYTDPVFIEAQSRVRGIQISTDFAENYEVLRWVIR